MLAMKLIILLFLTFSQGIIAEELTSLLSKAEACFESGDFNQTSNAYQNILQNFDNEIKESSLKSHIYLRLAHAKFLEKKYEDVVTLLVDKTTAQPIENLPEKGFLILGLTYKELGLLEQALEYLLSYQNMVSKTQEPHFHSSAKNEIVSILSALEQPANAQRAIDTKSLSLSTIKLLKKSNARAFLAANSIEGDTQALGLIQDLRKEEGDSSEILFLEGLAHSQLAQHTRDNSLFLKAEECWKEVAKTISEDSEEDLSKVLSLNALASLYFQLEKFSLAEETFCKLSRITSHTPYAADALFFASVCAEKQMKDQETIFNYRTQLLEKYPHSTYAAEAYLNLYPYTEYLHGDPHVIEHLKAMPSKYSSSPHVVIAYYLIGLDWKKDRRTFEGAVLRKKNLGKAIEAFQNAESNFDHLYASGIISKGTIIPLITTRYRSMIERSLANKAIALSSKGAKRQVYLEYAIDVLRQAADDLNDHDHSLISLTPREIHFSLGEEINLNLALAYRNADKDAEAKKLLELMLEKYSNANITRGYFLSRTWYELGLIVFSETKYQEALGCLNNSEDAAKGKVLSTDQKLDLWIQQSHCYRALRQPDEAMLILSKVVNEDAISQLRLKGMLLRAEVYEEQERKELAQRQLEFLAKKSGDWAVIAKEKLKKDYGY